MSGERIKEERLRLRYSQTEFSELAEISRHAQINYEKGYRSPDTKYLAAIAKLGVDVMYIITGVRSEPAPKTYTQPEPKTTLKVAEDTGVYNVNTKPLNKREQALLANYRESDEEAKKALESTARAFSRHDQKDGTSGK